MSANLMLRDPTGPVRPRPLRVVRALNAAGWTLTLTGAALVVWLVGWHYAALLAVVLG